MQIVHGIDGLLKAPKRSVISIGNFDGIHLGHRRILHTARELAVAKGSQLVLVTFEPHPMTVLRPEAVPPRLTPPAIKQPLLEEAGTDCLVILPPEKEVLGLTAEDFWAILRDRVEAADLVEGASFRFGKGARNHRQTSGLVGEIADDASCRGIGSGSASGFADRAGQQFGDSISAGIRPGARGGDLPGPAVCVERSRGKGILRGKAMGVPTANLRCDDQLIPADAVYAGRCAVNGKTYPAAVSIGTMPTFGENVRQIEAHLIGFDGDLYGVTLAIELVDWLREQRAISESIR